MSHGDLDIRHRMPEIKLTQWPSYMLLVCRNSSSRNVGSSQITRENFKARKDQRVLHPRRRIRQLKPPSKLHTLDSALDALGGLNILPGPALKMNTTWIPSSTSS